mmetsp:Transcript_16086/g.21059  ORF Transcript_16086/g.21059 Transcript_16086/m.21059 type:complete len:333 (-) Transcript_16086:94-1092(-)
MMRGLLSALNKKSRLTTLALGLLFLEIRLMLSEPDIPKVLVTSHAKRIEELPESLRGNIIEWQRLNVGFTLRYFDDIQQATYMEKNCRVPRCLEAYRLLESGAARADMFRMAFLLYQGGWWFDSDMKAGDIAKQCNFQLVSQDIKLFLLREPKNGHVRFMLIGGNGHPFLEANLYRQIHNVIEAKQKQSKARALFITGPFTLGRTLCDPFRYVQLDTLLHHTKDSLLQNDKNTSHIRIFHQVQEIASHCDLPHKGRGYFSGKIRGEKSPSVHNTTWQYDFGYGLFLFHFGVCSAYWHRPGARNMVYQDVLKSMNVTHHLQSPARRWRRRRKS